MTFPDTSDEYRLTLSDERRIRARLAETVADWRRSSPAPLDAIAVEALVRIGAGAIGCGPADLREVELEWITEQAKAEADRG